MSLDSTTLMFLLKPSYSSGSSPDNTSLLCSGLIATKSSQVEMMTRFPHSTSNTDFSDIEQRLASAFPHSILMEFPKHYTHRNCINLPGVFCSPTPTTQLWSVSTHQHDKCYHDKTLHQWSAWSLLPVSWLCLSFPHPIQGYTLPHYSWGSAGHIC